MTFIAQTKDSLWSLDLLRCESILLRSHWVLVALELFTRRIVGFGIAREGMDGISVCRMFNDAIFGQPLPKRLSTDHDPLFRFHRWLAHLRVLEIEQVKTVPYVPVSHPIDRHDPARILGSHVFLERRRPHAEARSLP